MAEATDLQMSEKKEVVSPAEQTRPGLVFTPEVDIYETDRAITLLADMPGVSSEQVTIDLNDNVLTITGEVDSPMNAGEKPVLIEYDIGKYYRQFTLSEAIDQERIEAAMQDGVLTLAMPKAARAMPRKITVTAS